jgi:hypothetical protein
MLDNESCIYGVNDLYPGPYTEAIQAILQQKPKNVVDFVMLSYAARGEMTRKFAWAIPGEQAVKYMAKFGSLVEMGAGKGYWALCLQAEGCTLRAFDNFANKTYIDDDKPWFPVEYGTPATLKEFQDSPLFLCWPPYNSSFASDCLKHWKGKDVFYVGEGYGGCTGDDDFHQQLESDFEQVEVLEIPQWMGIHDRFHHYQRRG